MFPSRAAVLGLLVPLTLLAACQRPSPTPAPAPSFRCTPEAGGDEYDCSQAQHDEMVSKDCLLYTSPSPRDGLLSRMPSSA